MRLLLDMNLPPSLAGVLQSAGHECAHWSERGDPRASDETILRYAQHEELVVITHDLDFGAILAATRADSPSVVQLRVQDILSSKFVSTILVSLDRFQQDLKLGALLIVNESKTRVRILPLGEERDT